MAREAFAQSLIMPDFEQGRAYREDFLNTFGCISTYAFPSTSRWKSTRTPVPEDLDHLITVGNEYYATLFPPGADRLHMHHPREVYPPYAMYKLLQRAQTLPLREVFGAKKQEDLPPEERGKIQIYGSYKTEFALHMQSFYLLLARTPTLPENDFFIPGLRNPHPKMPAVRNPEHLDAVGPFVRAHHFEDPGFYTAVADNWQKMMIQVARVEEEELGTASDPSSLVPSNERYQSGMDLGQGRRG